MNNMESSLHKATVKQFYEAVINDVISGVHEEFIEEGIDEEVLEELKQTWEAKLKASQSSVDMNNANLNTDSEQQVQETKEAIIKKVPLEIILPSQSDINTEQKVVTIQVPPSVIKGNYIWKVLSGPLITATMNLPPPIAAVVLQHHVDAALMSLQGASGTVEKPSTTESNNQSQTQLASSEIQSEPSTSNSGMMVSCKRPSAELPASVEDESPASDNNVYRIKKKKMKTTN